MLPSLNTDARGHCTHYIEDWVGSRIRPHVVAKRKMIACLEWNPRPSNPDQVAILTLSVVVK
jgi:hypothetical protein